MLYNRFWGYPCGMYRGTPKIAPECKILDSYGRNLNQGGRTLVVPNQKTPKIWQGIGTHGNASRDSMAGNRISWECSLRFIGRGIGTHGNAV